MKCMNKVISLSWVLLALFVISCGSSGGSESDQGTGGTTPTSGSSGSSSASGNSPEFNVEDGGLVVFSAVENGRTLVLLDPTVFTTNFESVDDLYEVASFGAEINSEVILRVDDPAQYFSAQTGLIQFYITGVSDGTELILIVIRNTGQRLPYTVTLSSQNTTYGTTVALRYNPIQPGDDDEPEEELPCDIDPTMPGCGGS